MLHSRTSFERNELLRNSESRQIIKRVEDNRTSLLSLRDTQSQHTMISNATETWSLFDREFDFDQDVITTNVYRAALKSNMREASSRTTSQGRMLNLNNTFLETTPEDIQEDTETPLSPQAQIQIDNSHPLDWLRQSSSPHPVTEDPNPPGQFMTRFESDHEQDPKIRIDHQKSSGTSLESSMGNITVSPGILAGYMPTTGRPSLPPAPGSLGLPTQVRRGRMQLMPAKKSNSTWKLRIPKLFTSPSNMAIPNPINPQGHSYTTVDLFKVLLLGISETGKSSLLKSFKIALEGSCTLDERISFKDIIFSNIVQSMRVILEAMEKFELPLDFEKNAYHVQTIFMQPISIESDSLSREVWQAIEALWKDKGVREAFERSNEFQLNDSAARQVLCQAYCLTRKYSPEI
jgi:hypothetical protein